MSSDSTVGEEMFVSPNETENFSYFYFFLEKLLWFESVNRQQEGR